MVEKTANFECDMEIAGNAGIPQTFGLDIELKGNFTFSWSIAYDNIGLQVLCGKHFFYVKELVRRTHFGAIPVVPLDPERFLQLNGSDAKLDPQLSYIYSREIDLSLDSLPVSYLLMPYMDISQSEVGPSISLMGGFYPNTNSNPLFGIWILILLTLFISPFALTFESLFLKNKRPNQGYTQLYRKHFWSVFNAMFMPTFDFKYLNLWSNRIIIGFLLIFKVFDSTLFSSQILSITIEDNYYVIDSIEDLFNRTDLEPIFFVPWAFKNELESEPGIKDVYGRVSEDDFLEYDFEKLLDRVNELINNISIKLNHIMVISPPDAEALIAVNPSKYKTITHLSNRHYMDSVYGFAFHKDVDPLLRKTFTDIISDTREGGLIPKYVETALRNAYKILADKDFVFDLDLKPPLYMQLDEMKIVLGPYIVGMILAFFALLYEYSSCLKNNNHGLKITMKKTNEQPARMNTSTKRYTPVLHYPEYKAIARPIY